MSKKGADDTQLKAIYYDKNVNTSSAKRLYDAVKQRGLKATMAQVDTFIKNWIW